MRVFYLMVISSSILMACQVPAGLAPASLGQESQQTAQSVPLASSVESQNLAGKSLTLDEELNLLSQIVRKYIFAERDLNQDQVLTRTEFAPPGPGHDDELFQAFDQNQDQLLNLQEILTGPPIHYAADIDTMKWFIESNLSPQNALFGFDQNKDNQVSRPEMESVANRPSTGPKLKDFVMAEFQRRDLNQDQVLDLNETKLFGLMFCYKYGMKDTLLPSEQTK